MIRFRIPLENSDTLNFCTSPETTAYAVAISDKKEIAEFLDTFPHKIRITLTQDYDEYIHDIAKIIARNNSTDTVEFFEKLIDAIKYENYYVNYNILKEAGIND